MSTRQLPKSVSIILRILNHPTVVVLLAFGVVYLASLSFVYVEGDDASSVAFHALGRNASLQPPYSPYHAFVDTALSALPPREPALRVTAVAITSIAAIVLVLLISTLVFHWLPQVAEIPKAIAVVIMLIISPEFFYLGMVYSPTVVAMSLVLASHLLIRRVWQAGNLSDLKSLGNQSGFFFSLLLFGVGGACRWNIATYGLVIVSDLMISGGLGNVPINFEKRRIIFGFTWGALALAATFAAIVVSGYGIRDVGEVIIMARGSGASSFSSVPVASIQTLVTPAALLLGSLGFLALIRHQKKVAILVVIGILIVLPFASSGIPKLLMPAIPGLIACVISGFRLLWFSVLPHQLLLVARISLCAIMLGPWLLGIKVYSSETSWGPGFTVRPANAVIANSKDNLSKVHIGDRSVSVRSMSLTTGGGFAVSTSEGPRPLGGHASVLLGGGWRSLANHLEQERKIAVQRAISLGSPLLQDDGNSYIVVQLLQIGFITEDPRDRLLSSGLAERRFFNDQGKQLTIFRFSDRNFLFVAGQLEKLAHMSKCERVVLYSGHSSTLLKLSRIAPGAIEILGPFSAIIHINDLRKTASPS